MTKTKTAVAFGALAMLLHATTASAADKVSLMFDWIPGGIAGAAWYGGAVNGCFEETGLEFSFDRGAGSTDTVAKVASGLADVGYADLGAVLLGSLNNGADVKALVPVYADSAFGVLTLSNSGITDLKGLEGKKLGSGPGDVTTKMLPVAMEAQGADFSKVERETADYSALFGLLLQGRTDANTTFLTTAHILDSVAKRAGKEVSFIHFGKDLDMYGQVVFANGKFLAERPDVAHKVIEATECVFEAIRVQPDIGLDALLAEFPEKKRDAEMASVSGGLDLIFNNETFAEHGFAWDDERVLNTFRNVSKAQGLDAEGDPLSVIYRH